MNNNDVKNKMIKYNFSNPRKTNSKSYTRKREKTVPVSTTVTFVYTRDSSLLNPVTQR